MMNTLIINRLDYARIKKSINDAKQSASISNMEAEKLLKELDVAEIVDPEAVPNNVVTMNSIVKISFLHNDKQVQLQIVYPDQAN